MFIVQFFCARELVLLNATFSFKKVFLPLVLTSDNEEADLSLSCIDIALLRE